MHLMNERVQKYIHQLHSGHPITKSSIQQQFASLDSETRRMEDVVRRLELAKEKATSGGWARRFGAVFQLMFIGGIVYFLFFRGGGAGMPGLGELTEDVFDESILNGESDDEEEDEGFKFLGLTFGKSKKRQRKAKRKVTTFKDVKGNDDSKEELRDIVRFLQDPEYFADFGVDMPKGVLMTGPPGCGKTLLARALAGEAGVPFLSANGSSFDQMFVGLGAQRIRKMFARARELAPCIVFIDEIDALGMRRDTPTNYSRNTLNQLLGELDGFATGDGVIVIGATNMSDKLDPALVRPGRFDRKVNVGYPEKKTRRLIIKLNLKGKKVHKNIDVEKLAHDTWGMSGADLKNMVNRAALEAVKDNSPCVMQKHLELSRDIILMGRENKSMLPSLKTKKCTAYHEAGHAMVALFTAGANTIYKATVTPRGQALGMVTYTHKDEHQVTREELMTRIDLAMGGTAAEELIFGADQVSSGATSDLQSATDTATRMVTQYGMNATIGKVYYTQDQLNKCSPEMHDKIQAEVKKTLDASYQRAKTLLSELAHEHKLLAEALLERETLTRKEIKDLLDYKNVAPRYLKSYNVLEDEDYYPKPEPPKKKKGKKARSRKVQRSEQGLGLPVEPA